MEQLIDLVGDGGALIAVGALTGALFGAAAQHSRFCLRAATVEVAERKMGPKFGIWLIAFCAAVAAVQLAIVFDIFDPAEARQLAATGSMSGAIIGGLMFGAGMILARGCASRLLVLSATGNLRAIITGLVLTLVAQASLRGVLSPARESLGALWLVPGGEARSLLSAFGLSNAAAAALAVAGIGAGLWMARRGGIASTRVFAAGLVGIAVALGWVLTFALARTSFEVVPISSVTFTGPSTDTLMGLVNSTDIPLSFGFGLIPGVFAGSFLMALATREFAIQRFGADTPMERYLVGAALMGFGSMLAGGCAVGAGVTGGAIFAITAWVAVFSMWVGAVITHLTLGAIGPAPQQA
jgi:uncharacterized membrane protein YedE/YeeE